MMSPSLFDLYMASSVDGGPWAAEDDLIARHGLSYVLVECTPTPEGAVLQRLVIENNTMSRMKEDEQGLEEFGAFYAAHTGIRYEDLAYASALGFATVGTNDGHNGTSGEPFLNNPDVVEDFAYRA